MQQHLQVFEYKDRQQFRALDFDDEPWFVLVDVCRALDIKNPSDAATRLDDDEKMTIALTEGQSGVRGGARRMILINESGLYSLVLRSDKPEAKRFKRWVTHEVLPEIRRTGTYVPGRKGTPRFIRRFNENWNRTDPGHFSIISELAIRLWGRLEQVGYTMADVAPDGTELRPDISVGRHFSTWLREEHPEVADDFSFYPHWTQAGDFDARQYPVAMLPLYLEFVDSIWIPKHSERYFRQRDPKALPHLSKLLPNPEKPRAGMMRRRTVHRLRGTRRQNHN